MHSSTSQAPIMETRTKPEAPPVEESPGNVWEPDPFGRSTQGDQLKRLLLDLLGRWHWIAFGLILGVLFGFYQLSKAPKIYRATSTLLVKQRTASVMNVSDSMSEIDMGTAEAMNTVAERLKRYELLERVAARFDIRQLSGLVPEETSLLPEWAAQWRSGGSDNEEETAPGTETVTGLIGSWMEISVRKGTRLLDVSIEHPVPEVAKALADAVTREYITEMATSRFTGRSTAIDLLTRESEEARTSLQDATTAHSSYQRALETHRLLEAKEAEVAELNRRYLDKHPKMMVGNEQLKEFQEQFLSEFESARLSLMDKDYWETAAPELEATAEDPQARLATARRLLLTRTSVLEAEISSLTNVYNMMLQRIQDWSIEQEQPVAEIEISNLARTPRRAISPRPPAILMKAGIGGLAFGLGLAFLLVKLDTKVRQVGPLEQETGLPVLAVIADLQPRRLAAAARRHEGRARTAGRSTYSAAEQANWDPRLLFRPGLQSSRFAEMFRALRASVTLLGPETLRRVTMFASPIPGDGKSTVAANFALACGQQGSRTLLIDFDLRKPTLHEIFGLATDHGGYGLADLLSGEVGFPDACTPLPGTTNVDLMLAGRRRQAPTELLNPARLGEVLAKARLEYDVVVVDTAPLLAVPDSRLLAPHADNLCLVVRANVTPVAVIKKVQLLLEEAGTPLAGLVLNAYARRRRSPGKDYNYGFNQYGDYGIAAAAESDEAADV